MARPPNSTPHDALFKAVFSQPARAMATIRAVLPAELARRLDADSAALCSGSFVDDALKERHADLLFRARLGGREALVYLLFEHQSEPDALMLFRLLRYMVRIWDRWLMENPGAKRLPAIVPVVLSHGAGGWTAPRRFAELYDLDAQALASAGAYLPAFEILLDDLSEQPDEALRGRAIDALAKLALLVLKHARTSADLAERLAGWADIMDEVLRAPNGLVAAAAVLRYTLLVNEHVSPGQLVKLLAPKVGGMIEEALMTAGEKLIEQGRQQGVQQGLQQGVQQGLQQGVQQGRQQGLQEGLDEGQRELLLRLLGQKFGEVEAELVGRVKAASPEQVRAWAERLLGADSLAAVFAGR